MSEPTLGDFLDAVIERLEPGETAEAVFAPPLASWVTVCKDRLSVRWDVAEGHLLPPGAVGSWADGLVRELRMRQERTVDRLLKDIRGHYSPQHSRQSLLVRIAASTRREILLEVEGDLVAGTPLLDPPPGESIGGFPLEVDPELLEGWRIVWREE